MKLIRGIEQLSDEHRPCVASIGNFDGVHLGHQHIIKTLLRQAQVHELAATVITFEPLAKEFFAPQSVQRLTSIEQRAQLLFDLGVAQVLCIDFDSDFAGFSPQTFVQEVLVDGLGIKHLSVGDDFKFGKNRQGDFTLLQDLGQQYDFDVAAHDTFEINGERVSSGRVRQALAESNFAAAQQLLGRAYSIDGLVSRGQQLGRTINFPTANIVLPTMLTPLSGVFAVQTVWQDRLLNGVANLGTRPTVDGSENRLEVHLFDFDEDLYDQTISVTFIAKIRDEEKFDSFDLLKAQIAKDARAARSLLTTL